MKTDTRQDDKKITDDDRGIGLYSQHICDLAWEEMDEKQRNLITSVMDIKKQCLAFIEDQFTQQFHDVGDAFGLVARCEVDDPYTGVSGGKEIAKFIVEICEKYLPGFLVSDDGTVCLNCDATLTNSQQRYVGALEKVSEG